MKTTYNKAESKEKRDSHLSLSIIPLNKNKTPINKWSEYQSRIAPFEDWHPHYLNNGSVGIITGEISGNLECIDIDIKNDPNKTIVNEYLDLIPEDLQNKLIAQTTPNGGLHLIYRCHDAVIDKSHRLALHTDKAVIIETRGEGGYFATSLDNNKILNGQFNLETLDFKIPKISKEERDFLLETARSLTRYFPDNNSKNVEKSFEYKEPAINDFNNKYDVIELFAKHNWDIEKEDDEKVFLKRPNSSAFYSGYYFKKTKTFFCFSTSTEFKPGQPYNHFQVLQVLEGNNDYKTTLRLLPKYGFEVSNKSSKQDRVSAEEIAEFINSKGVKYDSFIQDLTFNDKPIEERDYNTLYINLKKHFDKQIPRTRFEEVIKSRYINTYNPIEEFIQTNKHRHSVGVFEEWFSCLELQNESIDKTIVLKFIKKWYVGIIAQALNGEFPNEFFLTLVSIKQGIGKTSFLRNFVLPKELLKYCKEHSLSFDDDFKVLMAQALIIVDDEMDGRTYNEDKTFKTVLSNKEVTMRRKYDRRISTLKRRCSFAGSGNNLFVVREQQNRRIIPIELKTVNFEKLEKIDLTDLFMEAYNLYVNGFKYHYEQGDIDLLKQIYDDYVQLQDIDMILDEYIQSPDSKQDIYHIPCLEIVTKLILKFPDFRRRINVTTIGKKMAERGIEKRRAGKAGTTYYVISQQSKIIQIDETMEFI